MDNLIFCLNVTVPIFLTLLLGYFFRRIGLFDETFVNRMNKFVFVIPCLCFCFRTSLKSISMRPGIQDGSFLFCDHIAQYYDLRAPVPFSPPFRYPGRVYPGILPQQRSDPWYRHYPEPLRKCRYGTTDDHCQRPSLQCNGCCSSLCL